MSTCLVADMKESNIKKTQSTEYTRGEVALHKKPQDLWIIIDGKVYDVTSWLKHHPGGKKIIQHYGGEDATVCIVACKTINK